MADRFLLVLWLTEKCNLHCTYCYASAGPEGRDMDFDTAKRAIDALRSQPLKIQFAGGEPLLNFPLAERICRYVRQEHIDAVFRLQTNATLLTEELVEKLRQNRISVGVSLDGIPEVNALTRGGTAQAVRGIRLLGQAGLLVGLNAVVTARNVKSLPKLVDFAFYLQNVGGIGLDLLRHAGRGETQEDASPEDLREALIAMDRRCRELKSLFGVTLELREVALARRRLAGQGDPHAYCYASCGRSAVVLPDGRAYPCGSLVSAEYDMGPAEALVPGQLRSLPGQTAPHCGTCPYGPVCPRGCPSRQIRNHSDLECVLLKTAFALAERKIQ